MEQRFSNSNDGNSDKIKIRLKGLDHYWKDEKYYPIELE